MEREETFARLQKQMATIFEVDADEITEDARLVDNFDADSLDVLELVLALKDDFGINVDDGEVKQLLRELARFLPDPLPVEGDLDDEQLAAVAERLEVGTIVDFIQARVVAQADNSGV